MICAEYVLTVDWGDGPVDETANLNHATIRRGFSSPLARTATVGRATFTLSNHDRDYSPPLHATVLPRCPVVFAMTYAGVTETLFSGFTDSIRPTPNICGTQKLVALECVDRTILLDQFEGDIALLQNVTADDIIDEVITSVYLPGAPPAMALEAGVNVFPTSADRWAHGAYAPNPQTRVSQTGAASEKIGEACMSDWGMFFVAKDGTPTFYNRHHMPLDATTELTLDNGMTAMQYLMASDSIVNHVEVTAYPRAIGQVYEALGRLSQGKAPMIDAGPGTTQTFIINFRDPANNAIAMGGIIDVALPLPVAYMDYSATDDEAGAGTDNTANVTPAMVSYGDRAEITLTNAAANPVYIQKLQVRGYAVRAREPVTALAVDGASVNTYGRRKLHIDAPLMNTITDAQGLADYILDYYKDPLDEVPSVTFQANRDATQMAAARDLELYDRVVLTEDQTGVSAGAFFIYSIAHEVSEPSNHSVTLGLLKAYDVGGDVARWDAAHWDGPEVWIY